jgi:hypothetical protein
MFHTIANHQGIFGFPATWNYFEAGHGKGPCDGIGGTTKRMADAAVNSGKHVIQDAEDFYSWAKKSTMQEVNFFYVSNEECELQASKVQQMVIPSVKGTMKVHSVSLDQDGALVLRDTSCYCDVCLSGAKCESWRKVPNFGATSQTNDNEPEAMLVENEADVARVGSSDKEVINYTVGECMITIGILVELYMQLTRKVTQNSLVCAEAEVYGSGLVLRIQCIARDRKSCVKLINPFQMENPNECLK